jgi:hypothetical protein
MKPNLSTLMLAGLAILLFGHYLRQKSLLAKGWIADDTKPHIKLLTLNGWMLLALAVAALIIADWPYGLVGILLFIEAAVCFAFAKKLRNK